MKLMTAEVKKRLQKYPLSSQDGDVKSAVCSVKFFLPEGAWTWYVTEANLETGELFGVAINGYGDGELGYFTLQELESIRSSMGLSVERDIVFKPRKLQDITSDVYLQKFLESF